MKDKSTQIPSREYLDGVADGIYSCEDRSTAWPLVLIYSWRAQSQDWLRGYQKGREQRSISPEISAAPIENEKSRHIGVSGLPNHSSALFTTSGEDPELLPSGHMSGLA